MGKELHAIARARSELNLADLGVNTLLSAYAISHSLSSVSLLPLEIPISTSEHAECPVAPVGIWNILGHLGLSVFLPSSILLLSS